VPLSVSPSLCLSLCLPTLSVAPPPAAPLAAEMFLAVTSTLHFSQVRDSRAVGKFFCGTGLGSASAGFTVS
jgi:hypothetical protein